MATDDKSVTKLMCHSCYSEITAEHIGINCDNNHHFCDECSRVFIGIVLSSPEIYISDDGFVLCYCKSHLNYAYLERMMTEEQNLMMLTYLAMKKLNENEVILSCPYCKYFEIGDRTNDRVAFFCSDPDCRRNHCTICLKELPRLIEGESKGGARARAQYETKQAEIEDHFLCCELKPYLQTFRRAISDGITNACPECHVRGMKDKNCYHITCNSCETKWCYLCGLRRTELSTTEAYFTPHNESWNTNRKRCPMFSNQVHEYFPDWPTDDDGVLQRYHRIKTIRLLRSAVREMGRDTFLRLRDRYLEVQNCGFSMDEILNESVVFLTPGRSMGGVVQPDA